MPELTIFTFATVDSRENFIHFRNAISIYDILLKVLRVHVSNGAICVESELVLGVEIRWAKFITKPLLHECNAHIIHIYLRHSWIPWNHYHMSMCSNSHNRCIFRLHMGCWYIRRHLKQNKVRTLCNQWYRVPMRKYIIQSPSCQIPYRQISMAICL